MSMKYELAKKLKDNGFPQIFDGDSHWKDSDDKFYRVAGGNFIGVNCSDKIPYHNIPSEMSFVPTLSELIEACGDKIVIHSPESLDVNEEYYMPSKDNWTAFKQGVAGYPKGEGSTPEEAVANLWLD